MILGKSEADEYFFIEGCHILEWYNHADDDLVSVVRARVEPGVKTRLHRLEATVERYTILSGTGIVTVGSISSNVSANDSVLIPEGVEQQIKNTGTEDLVFIATCTPRFLPQNYIDCE